MLWILRDPIALCDSHWVPALEPRCSMFLVFRSTEAHYKSPISSHLTICMCNSLGSWTSNHHWSLVMLRTVIKLQRNRKQTHKKLAINVIYNVLLYTQHNSVVQQQRKYREKNTMKQYNLFYSKEHENGLFLRCLSGWHPKCIWKKKHTPKVT